MSWLKKQLNKLFDKEVEDEFYEEQDVPIHDHRQTDVEPVQDKTPKTSFRFPLITDEETVPATQTPKHQAKAQAQAQSRRDGSETFELPRHLQPNPQTQVYDVEVAGIRELLERRQKGKGHSNVIRSPQAKERTLHVTKAEKEVLTKNPVREERRINQEFINPLENRKKFVPTDVPSPVHGFNKPTPIETLMKRNEDVHNEQQNDQSVKDIENPQLEVLNDKQQLQPTTEQVQVIEQTKESIVVEQGEQQNTTLNTIEENQADISAIHEQPVNAVDLVKAEEINEITSYIELEDDEMAIGQTEQLAPIYYENSEQPPILAEEVIEEPVNEMQVQHVTIENSTIHIGQLNVEQFPQTELAVTTSATSDDTKETEQQTEPVKQQNTGSRLPFNVLMLKSDKQKLIAREIAAQQFRTAIPSEPDMDDQPLTEINISQNVTVVHGEDNSLLKEGAAEETEEDVSPKNVISLVEHVVTVEENESLPIAEAVVAESVVRKIENELNEVSSVLIEDVASSLIEPINALNIVENDPNESETALTGAEMDPSESETDPSESEIALTGAETDPNSDSIEIQPEPEPKPKPRAPYVKPSLDFLSPPEEKLEDREWMEDQGERLVEALSHFQIQAQIESIVQGPAVTQFEITVGHGTKVSKVRNLSDDIKLALAARDIRIDAPIPGKRSIGIEIPNRFSRAVRLSEVTDSESFQESDSPLEAALGLDLTGRPVTLDLRKMPHGLIAGATGSGKSVCINSILVSLLYKADPKELKLMLIDPKMVELAPFNHIPHLVSPVITDVKAATAALKWAVEEMERRYQLFMHGGVRDITRFNKLCDQNKQYAQKLPYMLIVIDELADLMMMSPADVEEAICRIAQKARACGIHLIVATQRPSVDVITGLIKSNIPTRIAFAVSSQIDSRTILDSQGAERLLGRGDMLYLGNGMSAPTRIQGTFVTDEEIEEIIGHVRKQGEPEYIFQQEELLKKAEMVEEQDELFEEVCRFVHEQGTASTSLLQRRYHIGYNRAARLIDMLEKNGFISEQKGSKARDVFITDTDLVTHFG